MAVIGETLTEVYTSQDEIERLMSREGVFLQTDDLTGSDLTDYFTEVIADGTDYINQYAGFRYLEADMKNNRWVRSRATWLGAYYLFQRRGQAPPAVLQNRFIEITDELEKVHAEKILIPRLKTSEDLSPAMSNLKVDHSFQVNKVRVKPTISTGTPSGRQHVARDPFEHEF